MNILIIGSGGREHALAWKIRQSSRVNNIFIAPGNAGTTQCGTNLPIDVTDFEGIRQMCIENQVHMVVVGPEGPLVEGIADYFAAHKELRDIALIGPTAAAAQLEGSKAFAKDFMQKYNIPTAASFTTTSDNIEQGINFLMELHSPYVLKADGLAAGKGVLIIDDVDTAVSELKAMLGGKFGRASRVVVIEEFLPGIELSAFVITDGISWKMLPAAKDYKRIGEADTGPNTGGMGAVSPATFADKAFFEKVEQRIIGPTIQGLIAEGLVYKGFIFFGLMNVTENPYLIEYNVRLGDPETECILPRIKSDLFELLQGVAQGNLAEANIDIDDRYAVTIMLASGGYPSNFEKNKTISGFEATKECIVFHAGTGIDVETGSIKTTGGRVIAITALEYSIEEARKKAIKNAKLISFSGKYYRADIGLDILTYRRK
jgi:phosphoribosylamine---glycine ligase